MACLQQDPRLQLSYPRRIIIVILGFLDNLLFGGAIFGWPQLVYVLKVEGVFSDLCGDSKSGSGGSLFSNSSSKNVFGNMSRCSDYYGGDEYANYTSAGGEGGEMMVVCPEQDERFALIYTIAVVCYGVPGIAVGFLLHYVGLMITRMLGGFMVASSFIFLALTTVDSPNWLFPATILLSIGGNQIRMSGMQFGDLFPKVRSTTITVLTGVYAASASLFLLFSIAQNVGVSRSTVCYGLALFCLCSALMSLIMPCHHIPYEPEEEALDVQDQSTNRGGTTLWGSFKTVSSFLHLYWFLLLLFCVNFYQQLYNVWITASTCTTEEAGLYSALFSYSNLISVFCAPVGGVFTDYLVRRAKRNQADRLVFLTKEIQANFLPLFLTTLFALIMQCCMFYFNTVAIIISLISMIIVRPCIIAISTAYIRIRFPGMHFNRLLGIYCTLASVFMFFQFPVFKLAQDWYYSTQGIVAFLLALSFINPLHILLTSKVKTWVKERENITDDGLSEHLNRKV